MSNRIIATIESEPIVEHDDGRVSYVAKAAIDDDGSDNRWHDKYWQADTSEHDAMGKALDAGVVSYIVVPPAIIHGVKGIVLGCQARVTNLRNGKTCAAVVGDIGPHVKLGEMSVACAQAIGIPSSPVTGGVDAHIVAYELWPGTPAVLDVDGRTFTFPLTPSRAA